MHTLDLHAFMHPHRHEEGAQVPVQTPGDAMLKWHCPQLAARRGRVSYTVLQSLVTLLHQEDLITHLSKRLKVLKRSCLQSLKV